MRTRGGPRRRGSLFLAAYGALAAAGFFRAMHQAPLTAPAPVAPPPRVPVSAGR